MSTYFDHQTMKWQQYAVNIWTAVSSLYYSTSYLTMSMLTVTLVEYCVFK